MKTLTLIMLLLAVLLGNTVKGQERPAVVDNTKYFPPYQYQVNDDCSHVALIYYLKSSLWNREFDRDPKLKENQFSNSFVWDQNANLEINLFSTITAVDFMKNQGCATVADFPITPQRSSVIPSLEIREKALNYKTKRIVISNPRFGSGTNYQEDRENFIKELKDSLAKGIGFCINFPIFAEMEFLKFGEVYSYKPEYFFGGSRGRHVVAVTGYNDTIKTANGRGAFQVINSWEDLEVFYIDYEWFRVDGVISQINFLEEDFSVQKNELSLFINLHSSLTNKNIYTKNDYRFVNGLLKDGNNVVSDYVSFNDMWYHKNLVQITKINEKNQPYNQAIMLNLNSPTGDYEVFSDISNLCRLDSFESLEITVYDPISAEFKDEYNDVIFSFTRGPQAFVSKALVHLMEVDSVLVGSVNKSSDTLMVFRDYRSKQIALFAKNQNDVWTSGGAYIKESSCLLARTIITFDRKNARRNSAPVFTNVFDSTTVYEGREFSFQFKASDVDNDKLNFSIINGQEAVIDELSGLFKFQPANTVLDTVGLAYDFVVRVSDGDKFSDKSFKIIVKENTKPYLLNPITSIEVFKDSLFEYSFQGMDKEGDIVEFRIVNLNSALAIASIGEKDGLFHFVSSDIGASSTGTTCTVTISLWDGYLVSLYSFDIFVKPNPIIIPNSAPSLTSSFDSAFVYVDSTYRFQFTGEDKDGDAIIFFLKEGNGASLSQNGLFEYTPTVPGTYHFVIEVSDGEDKTEHAFDIRSDRYVSVNHLVSDISFKAYPNPCYGILTISLPETSLNDNLKLEIFDLSGRLISMPINGNSHSYEKDFQYDASSLKNGVYICRLTINGQTQKSLKIVKN